MPAEAVLQETEGLLARLRTKMPADTVEEVWQTIQTNAERSVSLWETDRPLPFDQFCEAVGPPLKPRQYQAMMQAGMMQPEDLLNPDRQVQELVCCYGKGAGKDWLSARIVAWATYVCLSLRGAPAAHFGLDPLTELHILNTAPNEDSARNIFFRPYLKPIILSDIFRPWVKDPGRQILADEIRFPEKRVALYSMHSRTSGLDGYNTLLWVMDEADDFLDNEKRSLADGIHDVLRSSANTRFAGKHWFGIVISYPRTKDGFMMRLKERAQRDKTFYWDQAATWEVRPEVSRDSPGIQSDYDNDPQGARARYECEPMETEGAFIEFPERIEAARDPALSSCCVWRERITEIVLDTGERQELVGVELDGIEKHPGRQYFMGGDPGVSGDSFALSVWHVESHESAAEYLCDMCGGRGDSMDDVWQQGIRTGANYRRCHQNETVDWVNDRAGRRGLFCGVCGQPAIRIGPQGMYARLAGWWRNQSTEDAALVSLGGEKLQIPRIVEDALIVFKPQRATRVGQQNRPVDYETENYGVRAVCKRLIEELGIIKSCFDPSHSVSIIQGLRQHGLNVEQILFTTRPQSNRGRLAKVLLYSGALRMLHPESMPNETMKKALERRDNDWKKLQQNGMKLDHPAGGGKDCFDAETVAIHLCASHVAPSLVSYDWE